MSEYIEREPLESKAVYMHGFGKNKYVPLKAIQEAPTADVVEVKHAEWVSLTDCSNAGVYCSVCHKKVYKEDYAWCNRKNKLRSNYCPNCGADMRGGNDGEE